MKKKLFTTLFCSILLISFLPAQQRPETPPKDTKDSGGTFNFTQATLKSFIKYISIKKEMVFLYDAGDKAFDDPVNIIMPKGVKVKDKDLFPFFESVLEMKGFTLVEFPQFTKIIKVASSVPSDVSLLTSQEVEKLHGEERLVTMPVQLKYITAQEVLAVLNQLKSRSIGKVIKVSEYGLLLNDYSSKINKMTFTKFIFYFL